MAIKEAVQSPDDAASELARDPFDTRIPVHESAKNTKNNADNQYLSHSWPKARLPTEEPEIPSPALFDFQAAPGTSSYTEPSLSSLSSSCILPKVAECAAHLEFLEALHNVRSQVLASAPLNQSMGYSSPKKPTMETMTKWWDGKWNKYMDFAVVRFLAWNQTLSGASLSSASEVSYCPPLDVLMVWHSLLLNPGKMQREFKGQPILEVQFPWDKVHRAIDPRTWELSLALGDREAFVREAAMASQLVIEFERWPVDSDPRNFIGLEEFKHTKKINTKNHAGKAKYLKTHPRAALYAAAFRDAPAKLTAELYNAVFRQTKFVEKMHELLWIRSPGVRGTLERAVARYDNFCELLSRVPNLMMVPSWDVDLVWHTHQCRGAQYGRDMIERTGRFIDHDDSIGTSQQTTGYDKTLELYRVHFGQEYQICGCWECEALSTAMEDALGVGGDIDMVKVADAVQDDLKYYRAVEIARKEGKNLPMRR